MPIHLAKTLGSRWGWGVPLSKKIRIWPVRPSFPAGRMRPHHETSIVWLRFWWISSSTVIPRLPQRLFWTWTIRKMRTMSRRSLPFTTITTTVTGLGFFLKVSGENSSPRCFIPARSSKAIIIRPVLKRLRDAWPEPCIVLRGGRHFSNPKLMLLAPDDPDTDFIFGLTGNSVPAKRFLNAAIPTTKSSLSS